MQTAVIGLDLAKNVFQVHGIDDSGQAAVKRKLRRSEVLPFFAELDAALVGIEACHTAHYWGREIAALGHDVRLMPPQFVKPYVKPEERCRRRFGDRRSRAKTHDAICANQICGSAGCSNAAPDTRLTDSPAEQPYQRHSCAFCRIRHRG
jgi:transposase